MRIFLILSVFLAIALADDCQRMCPMDYTPICGDDGTTYSNECELKTMECTKKTTIKILHDGECTEKDKPKPVPVVDNCLRPCPAIYSPVCGSDAQTYASKCDLEVAACQKKQKLTILHEGECTKETPKEKPKPVLFQNEVTDKCLRPCPRNYSPVCGTDGATYANACELGVAACRKKKEIKIAYQGECGKPQPELLKADGCMRACTMDYTPECGTDGITYPNKCARETAQCQKKMKIEVAYKGECMKKEPRRNLREARKRLFP